MFLLYLAWFLLGTQLETLGSNTASTMMAGVPGVGAILGVIFLGETLEVFGWLALLTLTIGIIVTTLPKKKFSIL